MPSLSTSLCMLSGSGVLPRLRKLTILIGKVARKDDQMIAQGGISIICELNGLVQVLRGRCFIFGVGL